MNMPTRAESRWPKIFLVICALSLSSCAAEVVRFPTDFAAALSSERRVIRIDQDQALGLFYDRTLKRGSEWLQVGKVPQGNVFKPMQGIFTVEGAHVHEAYLVLREKSVVGFYLPVERSYAPLTTSLSLTFTEGR